MRVLLARHGQTDGNREGRCQGQADIPLNDTGRAQVAQLAARLAAEPLAAIYASDLSRAWESARLIRAALANEVPLHREPRLREISKGEWDGMLWDDITTQRAEEFARWKADKDALPPGGEPIPAAIARVGAWLDEARGAHSADDTILVVAHGAIMRALICLVLGIQANLTWHFHMGNAALSELRWSPEGAVLWRLNDTCHLR